MKRATSRHLGWKAFAAIAAFIFCGSGSSQEATAQTQVCDIPAQARSLLRCERGLVLGPNDVVIGLAAPQADPEALYDAGLAAANRRDWRMAVVYFDAAHRRAHLVPKYMYNLGLAHAQTGHEVPAMAWLSAYLIAAPEASNRSAVWSQIGALEEANQRKAALVWDRGVAAANLVPLSPDPQTSTQSRRFTAFRYLWERAASAGDMERATAVARLIQPIAPASDREYWSAIGDHGSAANQYGFAGAAADEDVVVMRRFFARERFVHPTSGAQLLRAEVRLVERRVDPYFWELDPFIPSPHPGDHEASVQGNFPNKLAALVLLNRGGEALTSVKTRLPDSQPPPAMEFLSAQVGAAFLFRGDLDGAGQALQIAQGYAATAARCRTLGIWSQATIGPYASAPCNSAGADSGLDDGWAAAELEALMLAERGRITEAVAMLDTFRVGRLAGSNWPPVSSGLDGYPHTFAPQSRWNRVRGDGRELIVKFLTRRGRGEQGFLLADQMDSIQRTAYWTDLSSAYRLQEVAGISYEAAQVRYQAALSAASGGAKPPAYEHRQAIETAINQARHLSGAAVDIDWWFAMVRSQSEPMWQVRNLAGAAVDLLRGARRVRTAYQRIGGPWGSDVAGANSGPTPLAGTTLPCVDSWSGYKADLTFETDGVLNIAHQDVVSVSHFRGYRWRQDGADLEARLQAADASRPERLSGKAPNRGAAAILSPDGGDPRGFVCFQR